MRQVGLLLLVAACTRPMDSHRGTPIYSWDLLPTCSREAEWNEPTHDELINIRRTRIRLSVPSGWAKAAGLSTEAHRESLGWADSAVGEWLAVGSLPLDSTLWPRGASFYLTDRSLDAKGDTIVWSCPHCLDIHSRCRDEVGGRRAFISVGTGHPSPYIVTVLWPQADGRWLVLQAGGRDSSSEAKLYARARRVEFE